ncbi:hypothetical protein O0I10_010923 [Lichtheimia ornata]|uniref:Membrane-associated protein n=1 Tax=Lichtheimia ornata TaxID=688661 RepID=A0AAD7XX76_9FUNG|nr:uncharacterized protein O0I10_010923 [Lichtheimia ornata]KAJ8653377.1 hypothetical protein O0I10_010923 [Lichtheimia ornata]
MASLSSIVACCWWLIIPYCRRVIAALIIDTPRAYDSIPLTMGSVGGFRVSWSGITDDNNKNPRTNMTMELYLIRGDMVVVASWVRTLNTSSSNGSLLLPVNSTMMMPPFEAYYYLQLFVNKDHLQQQVAIQGPISFYLHANTTTATSSTFLVIPTATPSPYFTTDPAETSTHFIIDASTTSTTLLAAATTDAILDDESTLVSPTTRAALEGAAIAATTVIVVALVYGLIVCCINRRHKKKQPSKNKDRVVTFDNTTTIIMPPSSSSSSSSSSCTNGGHAENTFMGYYYDSEYFTDVVKSNVGSRQ